MITSAACVTSLALVIGCGSAEDASYDSIDSFGSELRSNDSSPAWRRFAPDVLVLRGHTRELEAGRYGDVRLLRSREHHVTRLVLRGGTYRFRTLEIGTRTRLECAGPCNIDVLGRVRAGDGVYFGPKPYACVNPADVFLDSQVRESLGSQPAIQFGNQVEINALISIDAGTIAIGDDAHGEADLTSPNVVIGANSAITFPGPPFVLDDANPCTIDSCDVSAGVAVHDVLPDGASCDDRDGCTLGDTCQGGNCQRTYVTCTILDQCHEFPVCNPANGKCEAAPVPDGVSCSDGDACTAGDRCVAGLCTSQAPTSCAAPDACHLDGECHSDSGCHYPLAAGAVCGANDLAGQSCDSLTGGAKPYGVLLCTADCQFDTALCGVEPPRPLLRCAGNESAMFLDFTIDTYGRAVNATFGSPPSRQLSKAEVDELTAAAAALEVSTAGYDVYRGPTQHLMSYNVSLVTFGPSQKQTFVATLVDGRDASARVVSRMKDPAAEVALKYSCASFAF